MKKIVLVVFGLIIGYWGAAQDVKSERVPEYVKSALHEQYPESKDMDVEWEKSGAYYRASFEAGDVDHEVLISPGGEWVHSEIEMDKKNLPASVNEGYKSSEYASYKIDDVKRIESSEEGTMYRMELEGDDQELNVYFDEDGEVIKTENI
ncbi:MAG: PepSY-like domain-containing protein [Cytophagaceae bacterium]